MTIAEIKAELAQLDAQIAARPEPRHQMEVLQLRQARRRRELLRAELKRLERLANLPEAERERLRRHFAAFDEQTFQRLLAMDEASLQRLWPQEKG